MANCHPIKVRNIFLFAVFHAHFLTL